MIGRTRPSNIAFKPSMLASWPRCDRLVIDYPWAFRAYSRATGQGRAAESHYNTEQQGYLASLGPAIDFITDDNCVCIMWLVSTQIELGYYLMRGCGFTPITIPFVWVKGDARLYSTGMGYHTRQNVELCLLGMKGKVPRIDMGVHQIIPTVENDPDAYAERVFEVIDSEALVVARSPIHSRKPEQMQDRMEQLYGRGNNQLELFGRRYREHWTVVGNELDGLDMWEALRYLRLGKQLPVLGNQPVTLFDN